LKQVRRGGHRHLGRILVVAQLCISMTLLLGASLFIRTLVKLYSVDTGLRTDGAFLFGVTTKTQFSPARALAVESAVVDRLQSIPGVVYASAAAMRPITGGPGSDSVQVEGYVFRPGEDITMRAGRRNASGGISAGAASFTHPPNGRTAAPIGVHVLRQLASENWFHIDSRRPTIPQSS
jgi:hypothetical protein